MAPQFLRPATLLRASDAGILMEAEEQAENMRAGHAKAGIIRTDGRTDSAPEEGEDERLVILAASWDREDHCAKVGL